MGGEEILGRKAGLYSCRTTLEQTNYNFIPVGKY